MRLLKIIVTIIMTVSTLLSCKKDSSPEPENDSKKELIVGSWSLQEASKDGEIQTLEPQDTAIKTTYHENGKLEQVNLFPESDLPKSWFLSNNENKLNEQIDDDGLLYIITYTIIELSQNSMVLSVLSDGELLELTFKRVSLIEN